MTAALRQPSAVTRALLAQARNRETLDDADLRLIELLTARAGVANPHADLDALASVIAALCRNSAEGNLCLPWAKEELAAGVRDALLVSASPDDGKKAEHDEQVDEPGVLSPESLATRLLADAEAGRLSSVVGTPESPRPLVQANGQLYFHRHWFAERTVAEALLARAGTYPDAASAEGAEGAGSDIATLQRILHETLVVDPLRPRDSTLPPLALAGRQKMALVAALRERLFVLSGGPGTGKTTWTASWLRALLRLPGIRVDRVRLCAPTGRASQRLQESLRESLAVVAEGRNADHPDALALGVPVTTLHTLLGYQVHTGLFARSLDDPLDADWVLVDEASMVDVFLLASLVRALPPEARLILIGDADQLPPVDAGSVLGDLIPHDRAPRLGPGTTRAIANLFPELADAPFINGKDRAPAVASIVLDVSHRATGAVVPLAAAVLTGDPVSVVAALGEPYHAAVTETREVGAAFDGDRAVARIAPPETGNPTPALTATLHAWADAVYGSPTGVSAPHGESRASTLDGEPRPSAPDRSYAGWLEVFRRASRDQEPAILNILWRVASSARALAPLRRGSVSTTSANRILRAHLEPRWGRRGDRSGQGFHGAPVLITRNERATGLSNGEVGLWLETGDAAGAAVFFPRPDHPGGWLRIPVSLLPSHEPGFAVTVHKSQGSEYEQVLILLPEAGNRLLARETLYTAITRARNAVRIFGTERALREATLRSMRRPGGLRELLNQNPQG